ncbi:MAG: sigma-54-dependent Fis family transcriptional regulator [Desulfuromonadaceae bacterium]|nr:sigma-54-dependent Fis family transcriptional regulator [Desulfuromonadaceae bacterium]
MMKDRILVVDDESFIRDNLQRILEEDDYQFYGAANGSQALAAAEANEIDLVLLDLNLGAASGLDVLKQLRELDPDILVIIITGYGTVESAVQALKMGAYDYIKKPFKADAIRLIVRLALKARSLQREIRRLQRNGGEATRNPTNLIGRSDALLQVVHQVEEVALHETATVLITGESGTGKELVAHAIHDLSPRSKQPFIEINCGSLPFNLLESELFGHEKGAFTDAHSRKIGLFEEANGGTVFLDEIGEMDMGLQVKLLRVLEDRKIRRLGGNRNIDIDVRVVSATNCDLSEAIREKTFREDLFYRLNVFPIQMPPLRERRTDIPLLLANFLEYYSRQFNKTVPEVSTEALALLCAYHWPGNVRELRNVVERLCIMNRSECLTAQMLPREISGLEAVTLRENPCLLPPGGANLEKAVEQMEKELIRQALEQTEGNVAKTARLLQVARGTLRYKLDKYELPH